VSGIDTLTPRFVEEIPDNLQPGVFYISLEHGSMLHLCACGCGHEIALPLTPADWRFTFDGETISVSPSVGSWSLPCRSHYIVDRGHVRWAGDWTKEQIEAGRRRDQARKEARYGRFPELVDVAERDNVSETNASTGAARSAGMLESIWDWLVRLVARR
jgi:hypothetical protein